VGASVGTIANNGELKFSSNVIKKKRNRKEKENLQEFERSKLHQQFQNYQHH